MGTRGLADKKNPPKCVGYTLFFFSNFREFYSTKSVWINFKHENECNLYEKKILYLWRLLDIDIYIHTEYYIILYIDDRYYLYM